MSMDDQKRYRLIDDSDGSEPLGGPISYGNAYISAYPVPLKDQKHPRDLEIGESSICKYSLSGTVGVYRVLRVNDVGTTDDTERFRHSSMLRP